MKMTREHYDYMREAMRPLVEKIPAHYAALQGDPRVKDLHARVRWDWFHGARLGPWASRALYAPCEAYGNGLQDTHIDTALKAIVKELLPNS